MLCPKCGTEVPNGSFFCAECGADIVPAGDGDAVLDACRTVFEQESSRRDDGERSVFAGGDEYGEGGEYDGRSETADLNRDRLQDADGGGATATAEADWWEAHFGGGAVDEEEAPAYETDGNDDREPFPWDEPGTSAGEGWKGRFPPDDGTQDEAYGAQAAGSEADFDGEDAFAGDAEDGEPADEPLPAAEDEGDGWFDEDSSLFGMEAGGDVPERDDGDEFGDTPDTTDEDDASLFAPASMDGGRIRIHEGGMKGPRRQVPMPYDPMDDLLADDEPPVHEETASAGQPARRKTGPATTPPLPLIAGVAAVIIVVIAALLLLGGGIGGGDAGPVTPDLPAEAAAAAEAPTAQETPAEGGAAPMPAFTGSIVLLVTPTFDGYEAVVTGGSRIGDVDMIMVTVEDKAGVHTLDWHYPYKGESFVLMRGMYGGVASQTERVTAEAVFATGEKELIWDEEY